MLIGDIIVSARELFPDLPTVLPPPSIGPLSLIAGTFVPATYYAKATAFTPWGESIPSSELSITIPNPGPNGVGVTLGFPLGLIPTSLSKLRVYLGTVAGQESLYQDFLPPFNLGVPFQVNALQDFQLLPTRSTAFIPDSNGRFASAGTIYRWINEALTIASYICKGIPDTSGIQMVSGQGMYIIPGMWDRFENCWYDGYPVAFDARSGAFYRNVLSGITFIGILQTNSDRQIMEFQPQPSRSGGTTTLFAPIGLTDTTIPLTAISQIGLALGLVQVGTEVISYSTLSGNNLNGCIRGLGGTQQSAWPAGTTVKELNFRFGGLRLSQQIQYQPGNALISLQVPPGWQSPLIDYLVGRFREAEQNLQAKGESIKSFTSFLKDYQKGTKQTAGPRQVGSSTPAGDGYPSASSGGRIIVP